MNSEVYYCEKGGYYRKEDQDPYYVVH